MKNQLQYYSAVTLTGSTEAVATVKELLTKRGDALFTTNAVTIGLKNVAVDMLPRLEAFAKEHGLTVANCSCLKTVESTAPAAPKKRNASRLSLEKDRWYFADAVEDVYPFLFVRSIAVDQDDRQIFEVELLSGDNALPTKTHIAAEELARFGLRPATSEDFEERELPVPAKSYLTTTAVTVPGAPNTEKLGAWNMKVEKKETTSVERSVMKKATKSKKPVFTKKLQTRKKTAGYWYLPEDDVYSILGIEPGGLEYFDDDYLPEGVPPGAKAMFFEELENYLGEVESAAERVLDDARHTAKQLIDMYIKRQGEDPRDAEYSGYWYKNMADDFAHEVFFGLQGGDPEFNEIHLTYLPAMWEWLEMEEDPSFFDAVVEDVYDAANDAWEGWVKPTVEEAWDEAKKTVLDYYSETEEDEDYEDEEAPAPPPADPRQMGLRFEGMARRRRRVAQESALLDFLSDEAWREVEEFINNMSYDYDPETFNFSIVEMVNGPESREALGRYGVTVDMFMNNTRPFYDFVEERWGDEYGYSDVDYRALAAFASTWEDEFSTTVHNALDEFEDLPEATYDAVAAEVLTNRNYLNAFLCAEGWSCDWLDEVLGPFEEAGLQVDRHDLGLSGYDDAGSNAASEASWPAIKQVLERLYKLYLNEGYIEEDLAQFTDPRQQQLKLEGRARRRRLARRRRPRRHIGRRNRRARRLARKHRPSRRTALYYHHANTLMEGLMQEIESNAVESEGQELTGSPEYAIPRMREDYEDVVKGLTDDQLAELSDSLYGNWSDYVGVAFEKLHDKLWSETEKRKDAWMKEWGRAAEQYLAGRTDLSADEKEEAYDLLMDEDEGAFWAVWEESGSGIGAWECEGNWETLCDMGIDGAKDILGLMKTSFTLHEMLYDLGYEVAAEALGMAVEDMFSSTEEWHESTGL